MKQNKFRKIKNLMRLKFLLMKKKFLSSFLKIQTKYLNT